VKVVRIIIVKVHLRQKQRQDDIQHRRRSCRRCVRWFVLLCCLYSVLTYWNALMGLKTGFAAGIVGTLLGFPLDLVKTRQVYY